MCEQKKLTILSFQYLRLEKLSRAAASEHELNFDECICILNYLFSNKPTTKYYFPLFSLLSERSRYLLFKKEKDFVIICDKNWH